MQTISIISLKGGVAKTTTAVNMAYTLAAVHSKKVLIIDNDKQGNTSKAFKKYDTEDKNTVARMMLERNIDVSEIIKKTDYENIDIITANATVVITTATFKASPCPKRILISINIPTPIRKYGMNKALPTNSR